MIGLILFSIVYGYMEQWIKRNGFRDLGPHVFRISLNYHIPMLLLFFLASYLAGKVWMMPLMLVIEDISWFIFNPDDELDKDDWVNFGIGGIPVGNRWIPWTYIIGIFLTWIGWML